MIAEAAVLLKVGSIVYGPYLIEQDETAAQACDRAKQALGITEFIAGTGAPPASFDGLWTYPDGSKHRHGSQVTKIFGRYIGGWITVCLPAPEQIR